MTDKELIEKCLLTHEEYDQAMKDAEQEWVWNRSGKNIGRAKAEYIAKFTAQLQKALPIIRKAVAQEIKAELEANCSYTGDAGHPIVNIDSNWYQTFWEKYQGGE